MMRAIRVGIAGLGFVGRETARLLKANRENFAQRLGVRVILTAVCDRQVLREAKGLGLSASMFRSKDPLELARRPDLEIVVEVLGGLEAPRRFVLEALRSGKHVVTANKRLLAHCWPEIRQASAKFGGRVYFEAGVAGSIPIIQALDSNLAANRIHALYGILNGTTNYILCSLARGMDRAKAVAKAQQLGLAEKNPALDLNGVDTAHKLAVLAALVTGGWIDFKNIARQGITEVSREDMEFAQTQLSSTIRLLGSLKLSGSNPVRVDAGVAPTMVPLDHPLASVRGPNNAVLVQTSEAGELMFYGPGAGPKPAASAVVGDIFLSAKNILAGTLERQRPERKALLVPAEKAVSPFYLRLFARDKPGVLARAAKALAHRGISIATIHQSRVWQGHGIPIVITTHPASFGALRQALKEILASDGMSRKHTLLRMLT